MAIKDANRNTPLVVQPDGAQKSAVQTATGKPTAQQAAQQKAYAKAEQSPAAVPSIGASQTPLAQSVNTGVSAAAQQQAYAAAEQSPAVKTGEAPSDRNVSQAVNAGYTPAMQAADQQAQAEAEAASVRPTLAGAVREDTAKKPAAVSPVSQLVNRNLPASSGTGQTPAGTVASGSVPSGTTQGTAPATGTPAAAGSAAGSNGFSLTPEQIALLQERYMGVDPTGVWDENTQSRAGKESMEDWWNGYQASLAWDFGPGGNPSEEARKWAASNMPTDYAKWLVSRGEAPDMQTATQMTNTMLGTGVLGGGTGSAPGGVSFGSASGNNGQGIDNTAPNLRPLLDQWRTSAEDQARNQIDYATTQGVNELQRAEEDAQEQFQTQRNQVAAAEAKALDNQALYAERRGDRGGIGQAQYAEIQNNAAQNQLAVNQAQTKLSTDTARQIADLRAQGEYQKADQVLQIAQQYLSQLINLEQWQANYNLSVAQFNAQLQQWQAEFEADIAALTGTYQGQPTLASLGNLAEAGLAAAQSGIMPSESQLQALERLYGYDRSAILGLLQAAQLGSTYYTPQSDTGATATGGGLLSSLVNNGLSGGKASGAKSTSAKGTGTTAGKVQTVLQPQETNVVVPSAIRSREQAVSWLTNQLGLDKELAEWIKTKDRYAADETLRRDYPDFGSYLQSATAYLAQTYGG